MVDDGVGILPSVFFELLLEVVDEDGETACSASGRSNNKAGLAVGWPEIVVGKNKSGDIVELESRRDLAMATPQKGFSFL
jgi:hypothetical protein